MQYCYKLVCGAMDEQQYKQLLESAKAEYERKARELKDDYNRKVQSVETVWRMIREGKAPESPSVADAIREVIENRSEPFTVSTISNMIALDHPEMKDAIKMKTLSGQLTRMQQNGELELVERGSGTKASIYKKKA